MPLMGEFNQQWRERNFWDQFPWDTQRKWMTRTHQAFVDWTVRSIFGRRVCWRLVGTFLRLVYSSLSSTGDSGSWLGGAPRSTRGQVSYAFEHVMGMIILNQFVLAGSRDEYSNGTKNKLRKRTHWSHFLMMLFTSLRFFQPAKSITPVDVGCDSVPCHTLFHHEVFVQAGTKENHL